MNKSKDYYINTAILFLGKFSSQFMSFLLLPLFTRYLLADDYGYVDLLQTYINLIFPILFLRMDSAIFRFLIDVRKDKKEIKLYITNSLIVTVIGIIFLISIYFLFTFIYNVKYLLYTVLNIAILMLSNLFLQILRGLGKTKEYSISSIITGVSNLIINLIMKAILLSFNATRVLSYSF